ncbi:hypothetical protein ID866_8721 [Astraeus odoratus]|nr:hypothetical protein ID866_8721 [Astraeus odoratus]
MQVTTNQSATLSPAETVTRVGDSALASPSVSTKALEGDPKLDIEHALVADDPRTWSDARKIATLAIIAGASLIAGLCNNIQNPSNAQIEQQLYATSEQISLISLFTLGSAVAAVSKDIELLIGMRVVQAIGSSAVMAIGAATLADMYEPHQRGTMVGIYYSAPLLGPSLGPVIGGVLAQAFNWRAIFWFLVIWGGVMLSAFLFLFKDTFRKERSLTYQNTLKKRMHKHQLTQTKEVSTSEQQDSGQRTNNKDASGDIETPLPIVSTEAVKNVTLSFVDVNPFSSYVKVLCRKNNIAILIPSALLFAFSISIAYTCARTLALYYNYNALQTGLVLLSYGIGSILGSILGGRWSDRTLARLKAANGGISFPEMRLESTKIAMWWLPPSVIGYAWVCQERVHVAAICVMLFLSGFFSIWIYASTLSYVVDSNAGRSSTAVATNSSFRGTAAFIATEIAVPLQVTEDSTRFGQD